MKRVSERFGQFWGQRGQTPPAFRYDHRGSMATIGRNAVIAQVGRFRYSGLIAWMMWMFIRLLFIEQCHNRLLVLTQWLRSYFTGARSARLIVGASDEEMAPYFSNSDGEATLSSAPQAASGRPRPVGVTPDANGGPR